MTESSPHSGSVLEFVELARAFRALVDERAALPASEFLQRVHHLLPRLYSIALVLPDVGGDAPHCEGSTSVTALGRDLRATIGALDYYREIFDPYAGESEEPVIGSLSDDIADIYAELTAGMSCWDAENREGALWAWRFSFQVHWGKHLTSALRAMHAWSARAKVGGIVSAHPEA